MNQSADWPGGVLEVLVLQPLRLWVYSALVLDMLAFYVQGVSLFSNALWQGLQTHYSSQADGIKRWGGVGRKDEWLKLAS